MKRLSFLSICLLFNLSSYGMHHSLRALYDHCAGNDEVQPVSLQRQNAIRSDIEQVGGECDSCAAERLMARKTIQKYVVGALVVGMSIGCGITAWLVDQEC